MNFSRFWNLDPQVCFLNHGSFGACPTPVLQHQANLREEMERQPLDFFFRTYERRLFEARDALAAFVGARGDDLAFVPNATPVITSNGGGATAARASRPAGRLSTYTANRQWMWLQSH